ncbi:UNVERIFIED_CONTAM: hypothetical protein GTU68_043008 [Idotea baltica]|nr:hypothetical protein [Idotea baltica]
MVLLGRREKLHSPSQVENNSTLTSWLMRTVTSPNPPGSPWPPNSLTPFHSSLRIKLRRLESKTLKVSVTMSHLTMKHIKIFLIKKCI